MSGVTMRAVRTSSGDSATRNRVKWVSVVAALALGLLTACSSGQEVATGKFSPAANAVESPAASPTTLAVSKPANNAKKVLTSSVLTFATNGALDTVTLTGPDG